MIHLAVVIDRFEIQEEDITSIADNVSELCKNVVTDDLQFVKGVFALFVSLQNKSVSWEKASQADITSVSFP